MNKKVAVVIGRFHLTTMTEELRGFLDGLLEQNDSVLVFIGLAPVVATKTNPMDFETRKELFSEYVNNSSIKVAYIKDNRDNKVWSDNVDEQIKRLAKVNVGDDVTIYGRSFTVVKAYQGMFKTKALPAEVYVNSELINIPSNVKSTKEFRYGVLWATQNQYPKVYPVVDVAIVDDENLWLGRKAGENKFRFIGGFVDVGETIEHAAVREVKEETNLEIDNLKYIHSSVVSDFRYRNTTDCITTMFFIGNVCGGIPQARDDIEEIKSFDIGIFRNQYEELLVEEHVDLGSLFFKYIDGEI